MTKVNQGKDHTVFTDSIVQIYKRGTYTLFSCTCKLYQLPLWFTEHL